MAYYGNVRHKTSMKYYVLAAFEKLELLFFSILAVFLIFTSKINPDFTNEISYKIIEVSRPVASVIEAPFKLGSKIIKGTKYLIFIKHENDRLLKENTKVQKLYAEAINIQKENEQLKKISNFVEKYEIEYKTARVIYKTDSGEILSVLINAGKDQNIKKDSIVLGNKGMVGRIVEIYPNLSRVLLINNSNSRIPIITSESRTRGILGGNGTNNLEILYLDDKHKIEEGEDVYTSSDANMITPGIIVGKVIKVKDVNVEVKPYENLNNVNLVTISTIISEEQGALDKSEDIQESEDSDSNRLEVDSE